LATVAANRHANHRRRPECHRLHAGNGFEHLRGTPVFEHAAVAGQQQRRVVVLRRKDEDRSAKWRWRLDVRRCWLRQADLQTRANSLTVDSAADRNFRGLTRSAIPSCCFTAVPTCKPSGLSA